MYIDERKTFYTNINRSDDNKVVIRIRKSKDRQHNGQKDKQ